MQIELSASQLDALEGFIVFKSTLRGRDTQYFTDSVAEQNIKRLADWCLTNGMTFADLNTIGAWQLAFAHTKGELTADPHAPIFTAEREAFRGRVGEMSTVELKQAYAREPGFAEKYSELVKQEDAAARWAAGV